MEDVVKGGVEDAGFKVEARDVGEEVDIGAALFGWRPKRAIKRNKLESRCGPFS